MPENFGKKLTEMTIDEYLVFKGGDLLSMENVAHEIENMTELVSMVKSKDPELKLKACHVFGQILTGLGSPWQKVVEAKILHRFVYFLDEAELPQLQHEALGIISRFVEYSEYVTNIVVNGAIPRLVDLLDSSIEATRGMAITALGNIAKESPELCELVLRNGVLESLLSQFNTKDAVWVLKLFCKGKPQLKSDMVDTILDVLQKHLESSNEEILVDTCWTLASLCEVGTSKSQVVINTGVCCKLIKFLDHKSELFVEPVLEMVSNIDWGDQTLIEHMNELKMLLRLVRILLAEYDNNVKKNACKTISNIANSGSDQVQEIVGYGVVYVLADVFEHSDIDLKMELARTISIVTSHGTNEAVRLVSGKCVKPLCDMLDSSDLALILMCLGGLKSILNAWKSFSNTEDYEKLNVCLRRMKQVNGLRKIKNLQHDKDIAVSNMAKEVREMCWASVMS